MDRLRERVEATETTNATYGYVEPETVTLFVHQSNAGSESSDALALTYDAGSSDTGGSARFSFTEEITPDEHILVADGPFDREQAETGDTYAADHFVHNWGSGNTDGVVLSLDPFSEPTVEFAETEGLEQIRLLSVPDGDDPDVTTAALDASIRFEF